MGKSGHGGSRSNAGRKKGSVNAKRPLPAGQRTLSALLPAAQPPVPVGHAASISAPDSAVSAGMPGPSLPVYEHATGIKGRGSQLWEAVRDGLNGKSNKLSNEVMARLRMGEFEISPPTAHRAPPTVGPDPWYVPSVFIFVPKIQFPEVEINCPSCHRSGTVSGSGLSKVRTVIGLHRPAAYFGSQFKCKECGKFNVGEARVLAVFPQYVRDAFPLFLTRKKAVTQDVLQLLLASRDERAVLAGFRRTLNRFWSEHHIRAERSYCERLLAYLKAPLATSSVMPLVLGSARFQFDREKYFCETKIPEAEFWDSLWVNYHETFRQAPMLRMQAALPVSSVVSGDMSHKFTNAPFAGTYLVADNFFKTAIGARFQFTTGHEETESLFRRVQSQAERSGSVIKYFATDRPDIDASLITRAFGEGVETRGAELRSVGLLSSLPIYQHGRSEIRAETVAAANFCGAALCAKLDKISEPMVAVGIDAEWVVGGATPAEIVTIAMSGDDSVYIFFLGEMRRKSNPNPFRMPPQLKRFLLDKRVKLVGKQLGGDLTRIRYCCNDFPGNEPDLPDSIPPENRVELGQFIAKQLSGQFNARSSVAKMGELVLGRQVLKLHQTARWDRSPSHFKDDEITYCAGDACVHVDVHDAVASLELASPFCADDKVPIGSYVDLLTPTKKRVIALGIVVRGTGSPAKGVVSVQIIRAYKLNPDDEDLRGTVPFATNRLRKTAHLFADDALVNTYHGAVLKAGELGNLPKSTVWPKLESSSWLREYVPGDGNCFVTSLLTCLNQFIDWTGRNAPVGPQRFRDASVVLQQKAVMKLRRTVHDAIQGREIAWLDDHALFIPDHDSWLSDLLGSDDRRAGSQPYLEQHHMLAILHYLDINVAVLTSNFSTILGTVRHKFETLGPDRAESLKISGVMFCSQTIDDSVDVGDEFSDVGRVVAHYEPLFAPDGDESSVLSLCEPCGDTCVLEPWLPMANSENGMEFGNGTESGFAFSEGIQVGDHLHYIKQVGGTASRKHAHHLDFVRAIRDALLIDNKTDADNVIAVHLRKNRINMTPAEFRQTESFIELRETTYWSNRVARVAPDGNEIDQNLRTVMSRFKSAGNEFVESIITPQVEKAIEQLCGNAKAGNLSDPPNVEMYAVVSTDEDGLDIKRSLRGTLPELIHQKMLFYIFGMSHMSPRLMVALLTEFYHRWNVARMVEHGGHEDIGFSDTFELEPAARLSRSINAFMGDNFPIRYPWYKSVDNLDNADHYLVSPVPKSGDFDCLKPLWDAVDAGVDIPGLRPRDSYLARMFGLPRPLDMVTTEDERRLFKIVLANHVSSTGSTFDAYAAAKAWNTYIVAHPSQKLYPKIPCLLEHAFEKRKRTMEHEEHLKHLREAVDRPDLLNSMIATDYSLLFPNREAVQFDSDTNACELPIESDKTTTRVVMPRPTGFGVDTTNAVRPIVDLTDSALPPILGQNSATRKRRSPRCAHCGQVCPSARYPTRCNSPAKFPAPSKEESIQRGQEFIKEHRRKKFEQRCQGCKRRDCNSRLGAGFPCKKQGRTASKMDDFEDNQTKRQRKD